MHHLYSMALPLCHARLTHPGGHTHPGSSPHHIHPHPRTHPPTFDNATEPVERVDLAGVVWAKGDVVDDVAHVEQLGDVVAAQQLPGMTAGWDVSGTVQGYYGDT